MVAKGLTVAKHAAFHLHVSSDQPGALGIFHLHAGENLLAEKVDAAVRRGSHGCRCGGSLPLAVGELRYGWLIGEADGAVDEIMLARPVSGVRVLMTHGGRMVREAVVRFLERAGFPERGDAGEDGVAAASLDPLLAAATTSTQAAAILQARERARAGGRFAVPEALLATHRVLLAGPPNAGKSSLLNRLAGYERAFVHEESGATVDVVDELVDLGGFAVFLGDLPGFSGETEGLAAEAWSLAEGRIRLAEGIVFVCDGAIPWNAGTAGAAGALCRVFREQRIAPWILVVVNKADLPARLAGAPWERHFPGARAVHVCSLPGQGDASLHIGREMWSLFGIAPSVHAEGVRR